MATTRDEAGGLGDQVAHLVALGFEVAGVELGLGDDGGEAFDNLNAVSFEGGYLFWVVGDEADGGDAEVPEDPGGELELAAVSLEAKLEVGLDGVATLFLKLIGAELGHEADAATFLLFVKENADAGGADGVEGKLKLLAAVAAERVEDVASEALRVDAADGGSSGKIAHDEGDSTLYAEGRGGHIDVAGVGVLGAPFKAEDAEVAPGGGKVSVRDLLDLHMGHNRLFHSGTAGVCVEHSTPI